MFENKRSKDRPTRTLLKTRGKHMCYGRVSSSCSASRTVVVHAKHAVRQLPEKMSLDVVILGYVIFYLAIKDERWNRNCLPFRRT